MNVREALWAWIRFQLGTPYIWGGNGGNGGWDCSGFAQAFYQRLSLDPPGDQTAAAYHEYFSRPANGARVELADFGDMALYGTPEHVSHIAICVNAAVVVEAGGGGHEVTTPAIARERNAMVRFSPLKRRSDLLCVLRPTGIVELLG